MEKLPDFLIEKLHKDYTEEQVNKIIDGYKKEKRLTFRVNTIKTTVEAIEKELIKNEIEFEKVKWSKEALIIKNADEKTIQEMEIYKNGKIYLQSLSSMLPPIILKPKEGTKGRKQRR